VAQLFGMPMDFLGNLVNLGIAGYGTAKGALGGKDLPSPIGGLPGGSQWWEGLGRERGFITDEGEAKTPGGRIAAAGLQAIPSFIMGGPKGPQIPRALMGAATAGLGGGVGAEVAPEGFEQEGAVAGSILSGGRKLAKGSPGEQAARERLDKAYEQSRSIGIKPQPREMKVDKPQVKVQKAATDDLNMKEGDEITHDSMGAYRGRQWQAGIQPAIDAFDTLMPGGGKASNKLKTTFAFDREMRVLERESPETVKSALSDLQSKRMTAESLVNQIRRLRESATHTLSSGTATIEQVREARLQRKVAGAMEDMLEENIKGLGKPEIYKNFVEARKQMAKSFDYEAALDPYTGKLDARKFAALTDDKTLTGKAAALAETSKKFPQAVASPRVEDIDKMFTTRVTPMAITHPPAMGLHWLTQLADPLRANTAYQNIFVDPKAQLTPDQQRFMRALVGTQIAPQVTPRPQGE
jgi:hypothetical protein